MGWDWLYNPVAIPRDIFVNPIKNLAAGGNEKTSAPLSPQPLPEAPKPEAAAAKAEEAVRKRKGAATPTVFTDPLGVSGQADIVRKTLTGQ